MVSRENTRPPGNGGAVVECRRIFDRGARDCDPRRAIRSQMTTPAEMKTIVVTECFRSASGLYGRRPGKVSGLAFPQESVHESSSHSRLACSRCLAAVCRHLYVGTRLYPGSISLESLG